MSQSAVLDTAREELRAAVEAGPEQVSSFVFRQITRECSSEKAIALAVALLEVGEAALARLVVSRAMVVEPDSDRLALVALRFEIDGNSRFAVAA